MAPHGVPSCGDWALQRMGGVFIEGTVGTTVDGCTFERMDGNGVMVSRFNRNVTITNSLFQWIGDTAIAAWGATDEFSANGTRGYDGTPGDFPRFTSITHNVVREVGLWEKQSSAYFQAKAMQTTIAFNAFFNGPRAGVNFNDGFGGGNTIANNLMFNWCVHTVHSRTCSNAVHRGVAVFISSFHKPAHVVRQPTHQAARQTNSPTTDPSSSTPNKQPDNRPITQHAKQTARQPTHQAARQTAYISMWACPCCVTFEALGC